MTDRIYLFNGATGNVTAPGLLSEDGAAGTATSNPTGNFITRDSTAPFEGVTNLRVETVNATNYVRLPFANAHSAGAIQVYTKWSAVTDGTRPFLSFRHSAGYTFRVNLITNGGYSHTSSNSITTGGQSTAGGVLQNEWLRWNVQYNLVSGTNYSIETKLYQGNSLTPIKTFLMTNTSTGGIDLGAASYSITGVDLGHTGNATAFVTEYDALTLRDHADTEITPYGYLPDQWNYRRTVRIGL